MRRVKNIFLSAVGGPAVRAAGDTTGCLYRKELAYPGTFVKTRPDGEEEFELEVTEPLIDHWVQTFQKMDENGVEVPVPLGHTTDPERRRGTVERLTKEPNERGLPALFSYIRFNSPEVAKQLCNSNVSLFMPPAWYDGTRNKYQRPIQHVAITDYPVIPKLGKFQSVAAGHEVSLAQEEEITGMETTWEEVAQELGIEVPEGGDAHEAVTSAWTHGEAGGEAGGQGEVPDMGGEEFPGAGSEEEFPVDEFPIEEGEEEPVPTSTRKRGSQGNYEPPPALSLGFAQLPPTVVRGVANSRVERLRSLMNDRKILRPQFDDLCKQYCGVAHVGHALSMESADPGLNDGFETLVGILAKGKAMSSVGERTGRQVSGTDVSPIVRIAEQRQAANKGGR